MGYLQNLHTHTTYCDGKHTPDEMINFAINEGFDSLGFSGHSYAFFSSYGDLSVEKTELYKKEITKKKMEYADRLKIFLGLEVEMYSEVDLSGYDYLIGSVHYLKLDDGYYGFDRSADEVKSLIDNKFGGDGLKFAECFYETVTHLPEHGNFDIIGHFDLVTKNLEIAPLFDESSKKYTEYAFEAMRALKGAIPLFEVNTGAIARGYRTTPYPSLTLLKEFRRLGFGAVISSDCHDGTKLSCGFDDAREMLLECGFKEQYVLTDSGFEAIRL